MTREEKAKAYDEALDRMKHVVIVPENEKALQALKETIFPELAESEGERIRKALIEVFKEKLERGFEWVEYGIPNRSVLSWLEKQKEEEGYEAIPVESTLEYKLGLKAGKESEKQKSLNISAASEWLRKNVCNYVNSEYNEFHKCVEYDGSIDKERLINDFEEAMQKEQKPEQYDIDVLEKHITKDSISELAHTVIVRNGWEIVEKEQKPVMCIEFDNEFENQVSHLLASVLNGEYEYNEGFVKYAAQSLLGYAKNEQKPFNVCEQCPYYKTCPNYNAQKFAGATINGEPIPAENKSVDIPLAEWSEDDKIRLKVINEELQRFVRTNPYGTPLSVDDFAWLESLPERFSLQPKQEWPVEGEFPYNTPADTIEGEIENIWNKLSCENRFTATKEGFREVLLHFVNYVRNNAASGWSEEDEKIRQSIIKDIEWDINYNVTTAGKVTEKYNEQINWLKDLPFNLKKNEDAAKLCPNEWSEEDEKRIQRIHDFMWKNRKGDTDTIYQIEKDADWLKSLPERFNLQPKQEWSEEKYDGNMDKECIKLCDVLNSIPSIDTFESCCGHLKDRYSIWFFCNDIIAISRLGRCVERNYSDGKWELLLDSTDTHPTGVFWLRSKVPFKSYDEMEKSVNELCNGIQYWFNAKFDSYFNARLGITETTKETII